MPALLNSQQNFNLPDFSIVILCYRAEDSIRDFVARLMELLSTAKISNYELILVANYHPNSNDRTPDIVREISQTNSRVKYLARPKEGMMGWDMQSGLKLAIGNYIAVIDGDGQMPIEDLLKVYQKIKRENLDLVKTYRVVRGDGVWRKFISFVFNFFAFLLFPGIKSKDINAKPKIFTREALEKLNLTSDDWFIDAEIMIQARRRHFKIGEIPTTFKGLGDSRSSFVKPGAILEFLKNLIKFRIKEFKY
jgi:glycosyltransferase involved in cell wall biosynthesis